MSDIRKLNDRRKERELTTILGLQNSDRGPAFPSHPLLRSSYPKFFFQVKMLWVDPAMRGWQHKTAYSFHLELKPSLGRMRYCL